ncbi:glycoside hydrolase family 57 protein [Mangrovibacterium marinum]|uniref:Alpha-amylase n=1 Tax=Mangrovibacterium marinum TaxID=1639118 RepID=A0A2T5BYH8_9BACT|nr:glycoside hydrolase family 57 protein [Mangrovibacterium marinum]PTN07298.1 alpha-amylase [Mangrovibacterium marinum]
MRAICLNFQIHQPFRFRRYRFFDIGNDHYYYDDYSNETILRKMADHAYLPANKILLALINKYKNKFKVSFTISGPALEQFELYAPELLDSFVELAETGQVEFLAEPYAHSLVCLKDAEQFKAQVKKHQDLMEQYFGQRPTVLCNSEKIYSDEIGDLAAQMGFKAMLTEGAKHVLGWKSPNYLYCSAANPRLKLLMRNFQLSDDLSFRFSNQAWSEYPLTPEKFASWMDDEPKDEVINLFLDYDALGGFQPESSGIFKFLEELPKAVFKKTNFCFATPGEVADKLQPVAAVEVSHPIAWSNEERDLSVWLGNELQQEAFDKLYQLQPRMQTVTDAELVKDWEYLQACNHFYYMNTRFFTDGNAQRTYNPFESPYEAFINYMNVLSDFELRLNSFVPESKIEKEIAALNKLLEEKDEKLRKYELELKNLTTGKPKKNRTSKPGTNKPKKTATKSVKKD